VRERVIGVDPPRLLEELQRAVEARSALVPEIPALEIGLVRGGVRRARLLRTKRRRAGEPDLDITKPSAKMSLRASASSPNDGKKPVWRPRGRDFVRRVPPNQCGL
jgi:hypothetical protein